MDKDSTFTSELNSHRPYEYSIQSSPSPFYRWQFTLKRSKSQSQSLPDLSGPHIGMLVTTYNAGIHGVLIPSRAGRLQFWIWPTVYIRSACMKYIPMTLGRNILEITQSTESITLDTQYGIRSAPSSKNPEAFSESLIGNALYTEHTM